MLQKLNDLVEVSVYFVAGRVRPCYFIWKSRRYDIDKVNLVHYSQIGASRVYFFSVTDDINYGSSPNRVGELVS